MPNAAAAVDLVKVDKSERTMVLMDGAKVVKTFRISLGANPEGHKRQQGDKKTPEGTYTLDYKKEDSAFYRAMHISYPNAKDVADAKRRGVNPGGQIMVHGQKNGLSALSIVTQYVDWTDGCIAISNSEMDEFMRLVPVGTKIMIEW